MDEKTAALVGAAAALTVGARGLRPVTKFVMNGVVAVTESTVGARRKLAELYQEAKAERVGGGVEVTPACDPTPGAGAAQEATAAGRSRSQRRA